MKKLCLITFMVLVMASAPVVACDIFDHSDDPSNIYTIILSAVDDLLDDQNTEVQDVETDMVPLLIDLFAAIVETVVESNER